MSSTTSSDCESCECSQCTFSFQNYQNDYGQCMTSSRQVPIYATMAQPLIYYAQVRPLSGRQNNDQAKRENPFKKAFRWYTQERKAVCCENEVASERSGFANWLDNKYCEYLRESGQQPTFNEPRAPNTGTNTCQCPKAPKRFKRFKSPWRKRTCPANNSGDVHQKCPDGSCEYILKPKQLSRAASENCYRSPTSAGKSNATIVSSQLPCNAKCSRRSQSLSDVSREKYVHNKHVETIPLTVQEGTYISCECPQQQIVFPPLKKWDQGYQWPRERVQEAVQVPSSRQDPRNQLEEPCTCQKEKVLEPVKLKSKEVKSKNQPESPCACQKEKIPVVLIVPSNLLDSRNQPEPPCMCQKEKVPDILKKPSIQLDSRSQPEQPCEKEKVPDILKKPSVQLDSRSQPEQPCEKENVPDIMKEPSKEPDLMNQPVPPCKCSEEKVPDILKEPSKEQDSKNQPVPPCKCSAEEVPTVVKLPSYHKKAPQVVELKITEVLEVQQEKIPEVVEVQKEKVTEVVKVPSKAQEPTNETEPCCKCKKKKVPKVVQVPSVDQDPRNLPGLCCSCHVKKVAEVVQVPSQCRSVEGSCQYPEQKVVPVCVETQCETAPPSSAQNHGPCCCNTCKPAPAPAPQPLQPQIFCIPVKVQDSKIFNPGMCCTVAPSVQCDSSKKQKKLKQCTKTVATVCGEGMKSKVASQCQHQISECGKDNSSSCNCHEERQRFDPIPIKRESYSTVAINKETGEYSIMKEVAVVNKLTRCPTCASHSAAQTSDHSIRFENDGVSSCPYPLFFKIVYADVAKNEGCK